MVLNSKRSTNFITEQQQEYKIPTVINRYAILESLHEDNQVIHYHNTSQFVNEMETRTKIEQRTKVNKVIIIGDSHARGCAVNLLYEYNETLGLLEI
jgi:hypothetical protein